MNNLLISYGNSTNNRGRADTRLERDRPHGGRRKGLNLLSASYLSGLARGERFALELTVIALTA